MERIEINLPAWKMALLILGMAAFVFVGLLMVVFGSLFMKALGVIAILFFGGVCGYGLDDARPRRAAVRRISRTVSAERPIMSRGFRGATPLMAGGRQSS